MLFLIVTKANPQWHLSIIILNATIGKVRSGVWRGDVMVTNQTKLSEEFNSMLLPRNNSWQFFRTCAFVLYYQTVAWYSLQSVMLYGW